MVGDPFIQTEQRSNKIFALEDGHPTLATNIAKLYNRVREPACMVNMVSELANQSLLSGETFAEAAYVSICDGDEFKIYDWRTKTITVSEDAVLKGWRFPRIKLWLIPLRSQVTDLNKHTLLLKGPMGRESITPCTPSQRPHRYLITSGDKIPTMQKGRKSTMSTS